MYCLEVVVKYVCPYCDQPLGPRRKEWFDYLPETTEETLPTLIGELWGDTKEQPRATNAQGRCVARKEEERRLIVCEQHRYETCVVPLAVQYMWPTAIDFIAVLKRLTSPKIIEILKFLYKHPWHGILIKDENPNRHQRSVKTLKARRRRSDLDGAG